MTPTRWDQLRELYHAALEKPPNDRSRFLEEVCRDDALRREVQSLLDADAKATDFLASPALDVVAKAMAADDEHDLLERQLGHYRILSILGSGGMGKVYRARDSKLGREVALKVLPDIFTRHQERLERFDREARVLASLNHQHIATLYGSEEYDGIRYLVMELVEGTTLSERIAERRLSLADALSVLEQIAEGLEAAHDKGVVHRDLKPTNIKVTPSGTVKILDFGLAKALDAEAIVDSTYSPARDVLTTEAGTVLGTVTYMSPEQARGLPVDRRTDIWAFGCLLYECLTGGVAFPGKSASDALVSILEREPDWSEIPDATPPRILDLARRCLEKDPHQRLQHIGDARIEIEEALARKGGRTVAAPTGRAWTKWTAAFGLIGAIVAGVAFWGVTRPSAPELVRPRTHFTIEDPPPRRMQSPTLALSPDGTRLVYVADNSGTSQLHLRRMDRSEVVPIAGAENAVGPFFSPDGRSVGYFDILELRLETVPIEGGVPTAICPVFLWKGASWGPDDFIYFSPTTTSGIWRVPARGGQAEAITFPEAEPGMKTHRLPEVLPGGKGILFTLGTYKITSFDEASIGVLSLGTGELRVLIEGGSHPRYASTGHLLYVKAGSVFAAPFDEERLKLTGSAVKVLDGVRMDSTSGESEFDVSASGSIAYLSGQAPSLSRRLVWVDRSGQETPLAIEPVPIRNVRLAPDGRTIAVHVEAANDSIWIHDLARDTMSRLTLEWNNSCPIWTRDGERVAFMSSRGGDRDVYWQRADGSGDATPLVKIEHDQMPTSFSPDGETLAYVDLDPDTGIDLWMLQLDGDPAPTPFLRTSFDEGCAEFSPDGHWVVYVSNETGRFEVYVKRYPDSGPKWKISTDGGRSPHWTRGGAELVYRNGDEVLAVEIVTEPSFRASSPRVLFRGRYWEEDFFDMTYYDVTADGERFLMIQDTEIEERAFINVVLNWTDGLIRGVPSNE